MNPLLKHPVPKRYAVLTALAALVIIGFLAAPLAAETIEGLLHPAGRGCCSPDFP